MAIDRREFERALSQLPMGRDVASVRRRVEAMERLLEGAFPLPVIGRRIGLDAIIGLVPVVGDLVTAGMGAWLIWEARNLGMSRFQLARLTGNVAFDTVLGFIPFVGDVFDFVFQSNTRNVRMIKRWLDKHHPETRTIEGEVVSRREL